MCLAVPGQIVSIRDDRGTRMAVVSFDGIEKEICLAYLPEAEIGRYVIVHVGFAISEVDEDSALESLRLFREAGVLDEELDANSSSDVVVASETTESSQ